MFLGLILFQMGVHRKFQFIFSIGILLEGN